MTGDAIPALPPDKQLTANKARRLEWLTLAVRLSVIAVLAFASQSQGVKALWVKNILALLPPLGFLLACRLEARPPDPRFPYGLYRVNMVVHLINGLLLLLLAAYLEFSALSHLTSASPPDLGRLNLAGLQLWVGWLVIVALAYAAIASILMGRIRQPLARALHDKALYADTVIGSAEWYAAVAAAFGLLGVHAGLWWADYAAAALISLQIVFFGWRTASQAVRDLIDERPRLLGSSEIDPLPERIRDTLNALDWVANADVRLREHGRRLVGDAVVTVADETHLPAHIADAERQVRRLDWRLHDFAITPRAAALTAGTGSAETR